MLNHATGVTTIFAPSLVRGLSVPPEAWASRRLRPGFPKALRVFFLHNRRLFAEISKMISTMISNFYLEVAGEEIQRGVDPDSLN